ncbi:MAG: RNA-binding S4 domain-containing protein [Asticcacaulis sp.]
MDQASETCRIDVWLWRARFFKTRALSAKFAEGGALRLERFGQTSRIQKPGHSIRPGDRLTFAIGARLIDVRVLDTGERRGPASEAQGLYEICE